MLIDWFTVAAQALNFLILVWLLKRFLYQPVLDAIDAREKRIALALADAEEKKSAAGKERDEFQRRNTQFDLRRAELLDQARDEAKAESRRLLEQARKAADSLGARRQTALRNDARNLSLAIRRRTQQEVFAIARKALADLAETSLEERLIEVFIRRLREMGGQAKATLGQALTSASGPVFVRSVSVLTTEQRASIGHALNETFSAQIPVRFETTPDLVSGIELSANGQKIGWSIAGYLAAMAESVSELVAANALTQAATPPDSVRQRASGEFERQNSPDKPEAEASGSAASSR